MTDLIFPTIHLNGTSAESLQEDLRKAHRALYDAREAMRQCAPNGRDYYVQKEAYRAIRTAEEQHMARCEKIKSVMKELKAICEDIDRQASEREKAKARS